jgi:hypothetical protein
LATSEKIQSSKLTGPPSKLGTVTAFGSISVPIFRHTQSRDNTNVIL